MDPPQKPYSDVGYQQGGYQQPASVDPYGQQVYHQQPAPTYQQQPAGGGGYYEQQQYAGYQQQAPVQAAAPGYYAPPPQQQQSGYGSVASPTAGYEPLGAYQGQPQPILVGQPIYPDCQNDTLKNKFISQGYQDVWAAVVFTVQVLVTLVWGFVNVGKFKADFTSSENSLHGNLSFKMGKYLSGAAFTALGLACLMLALMRFIPRVFIVLANVIIIIVNLAAAIYGFAEIKAIVGVMFLIMGLLHLLWLYLVRRRIPLAGALLANSVTVVTTHFGAVVVSFASLIVLVVYGCFYGMMVVPTMQNIDNHNYGDGASGSQNSSAGTNITGGQFFTLCLFLLMFFWTTQVIVNVVHVTACGTVATWYFAGPSGMPSNPSVASLKRALTTSFGSICFGSLLVAILKLLHALARSLAHRHHRNFFACIAVCIIACLERLMEYFNVYAFTHVAIYGSSFVEAAKQTWELIKNCAISAIINDNLVFPVLNLTMVVDSLVIGVGFGYAADSWMIGILSFLISAVIHLLILRVVYSGVVTLFVCYAENPQVIAMSNPTFNQEMLDGVECLKQPIC